MLRSAKGIRCLWSALLCVLTIVSLFTTSALATESTGNEPKQVWVEVKAVVADDFQGEIIATVVNTETEEEYDFQLLYENEYIGRKKVPVGNYSVNIAFAPSDIRYSGIPTTETFEAIGNEKAAIPVVFTFAMDEKYQESTVPSAESTPEISAEPSTDPSQAPSADPEESFTPEPTPSGEEDPAESDSGDDKPDEDTEEPSKLGALLADILISVASSLVFFGIVCLVVYIYRTKFKDH